MPHGGTRKHHEGPRLAPDRSRSEVPDECSMHSATAKAGTLIIRMAEMSLRGVLRACEQRHSSDNLTEIHAAGGKRRQFCYVGLPA